MNLNQEAVRVDGFYCCYMMHTMKSGRYLGHRWNEKVEQYVFQENIYAAKKEMVYPFIKASHAIGNIIFKFPSFELMHELMKDINSYCEVILE